MTHPTWTCAFALSLFSAACTSAVSDPPPPREAVTVTSESKPDEACEVGCGGSRLGGPTGSFDCGAEGQSCCYVARADGTAGRFGCDQGHACFEGTCVKDGVRTIF